MRDMDNMNIETGLSSVASIVNKHLTVELWGPPPPHSQPSSSSLPGSAGFLTRGWPMFVGCGSPSCLLHYELACQVKYNGSALSQRNREVQLHWVSPTRQVPLIPPRYIRFNLGQGVCGMAACRDADWENAKSYTEIYFCLTLHVWKQQLQNIWCR